MPNYSCGNCGKEFSQKSHYDSHKRRKKPCENYSNKIEIMVEEKLEEKLKKTLNNLNIQQYNNMDTFKDLYEYLG